MENTGIKEDKNLEEQLEELKREQAESERIYRGRMELGALTHEPESLKGLAQTIMERKIKIDDLEAQIARENPYTKDNKQEETREDVEEKGLTVQYNGRNPILRFLQKIMNKLESKIQQLDARNKRDPMDWYKEKFEQEMQEVNSKKYSEYERMASSDFSKSPEEKTAHQIFVDKISGNGTYHTFGKNDQDLSIQAKNSQEINQNKQKQIENDDMSR